MEKLMHLVFNLCFTYIVSKVVSVTTGHLIVSLLSKALLKIVLIGVLHKSVKCQKKEKNKYNFFELKI